MSASVPPPQPRLKGKIALLFSALVLGNAAAWAWAAASFHAVPVLLGTAFLAYSFGLRHAVDADHIAAIDNVTRKLMQQGQRPVGVGFFFSLGHSTVVVGLSAAIALGSLVLKSRFEWLERVGGLVGTSVSAFFLIAVGLANLVVLVALGRTLRAARRGAACVEEDLDRLLARRGLLGRIFRSLFRLIDRSWQIYFVGFLFGLGFDTATEVGLLGLSATQASQGLPLWSIMVFPALFTAGMLLVDSLDSILMLGAYGWAFVQPVRKLYYNFAVTLLSVVTALAIGGIEALGLLGDEFGLRGKFWDAVGFLGDHFGTLGYGIVGLFAAGWLISVAVHRPNRYGGIGAETDAAA